MVFVRTAISFLMMATVASCSAAKIHLVADADANSSTATRISLVFVLSEASSHMLPNSAQSWFQNRRYFGAALGSDVFIVDLELPPATQIENVNLPRGARRAKSVVVYANYLHPNGQAGIQLGNFKSITVELIKESIEIRGSKCIGRSTLPR